MSTCENIQDIFLRFVTHILNSELVVTNHHQRSRKLFATAFRLGNPLAGPHRQAVNAVHRGALSGWWRVIHATCICHSHPPWSEHARCGTDVDGDGRAACNVSWLSNDRPAFAVFALLPLPHLLPLYAPVNTACICVHVSYLPSCSAFISCLLIHVCIFWYVHVGAGKQWRLLPH